MLDKDDLTQNFYLATVETNDGAGNTILFSSFKQQRGVHERSFDSIMKAGTSELVSTTLQGLCSFSS